LYLETTFHGVHDLTTTTLLIGLIPLAIGLIVGFVLARTLHPQARERKDLEDQLQKSQDQIKDYQQEVTEHFTKTSELINNLSHSYRDVHEHLATSAMRLTNPEISRQLIDAGFGRHENNSNLISGDTPEPPKDYAPKVPGGILSEEYGLNDETQTLDTAHLKVANDATEDINDDEEDPTLKVS
jgi:uncharacterized membrane-anchored protein YhcB (DUF1043 family)